GLAAGLRHRDRHSPAVERRHIEIDGGGACRVDLVGINDHVLGSGLVSRLQRLQKALLLGRLKMASEEHASAVLKTEIGSTDGIEKRLQAVDDFGARRQSIQESAGPAVLCVAPGLDCRIIPVLE